MGASVNRADARTRGPEGDVDQTALIDLRAIVRTLRRRALIIIVALAVGIALAVVAYLAAEPRYTATAQVALDRTSEQVIKVDQVVPTVDPDSAAVDTEVEVLRSPELIGRVVDALRLDRDVDFNSALADDVAPSAGGAIDPVARQRAIGAVLGGLAVNRDGLSYSISVAFEHTDPVRAAQVANAIVDQYVAGQVDAKSGATDRATQFLESRMDQLRSQVLAAEQAVADYRASANLFAISDVSTVSQEELSNLSTQLAQARAENAAAQARLSTARAQLRRGNSGEELGESLDSPVVSQLRSQRGQVGREVAALQERYGPQHPELRRALKAQADTDAQIRSEVERIVANTAIQANIASQRAASLDASIGRATGKIASDNAASVRLNELERNAESARTLYQSFLDRYRQTVAQSGLERSDSNVIAQARVPGAPTSPNLILYLAAGLFAGISVAGMMVLLLQMLEGGIESEDAVERKLGFASLGMIPDAKSLPAYRKTGLPAPPIELVVDRPQSAFTESFRSLRTSILSATPNLSNRIVAITSAMPGEGKTTSAIALWRSAAASGMRVLLIDGDARRRAATREFAGSAAIGVGDVLAGRLLADAVVEDRATGAHLLPQRSDGDHLAIEPQAFAALLGRLRESYDLILIDTPPVLAVDEARVIASLADGVVFLMQWRRTAAKAAEKALKQLDDVHANILGVVLTQVDLREQTGAGFHEYRQYHVD